MSTPSIAAYSFLSWVRQGLGMHIREGDQDQSVKLRGTIEVKLEIKGQKVGGGERSETVARPIQLYGPGDIIGLHSKAIVRTEPRHLVMNFETNYMPFVEFYEEDLPWRYTPARPSPDNRRLKPWIALVVLEEGEFKEADNVLNRPLSFIKVKNADTKFPPQDQLWAWAHVHVNGNLGADLNDLPGLGQWIDQTVTADRDRAYSRLLCPRVLKANSGYHAFIIPSFESGRLAGLGKDPALSPYASLSSWAEYPAGGGTKEEPELFPYYHRWYFHTGSVGDFEYLVRLLKPKPVDPRVGVRDMDVQAPGALPNGITDPELGGVLQLGGALRVPLKTMAQKDRDLFIKYNEWAKPYPHPFQQDLAALLNLPADYEDAAPDDDPLIAPPIYGRWHAAVRRLPHTTFGPVAIHDKWIHELNLDPRYRVSAGFGTLVVQKNQEDYMEAAWRQVGKVLEGNQKIRYGMMALAASKVWQLKQFEPLLRSAPERFLMISAPVQRRVLAEGLTVSHRVQESTVPLAVVSKTMRQMLRPRWRVARRVGLDTTRTLDNLLGRINRGEVTAAPPKAVPPLLPTEEKIAERLRPRDIPPNWLEALRRDPLSRWLPLLLALIIFLLLLPFVGIALAFVVGAVLVAVAFWLAARAQEILKRDRAVSSLLSENQTPEAIDQLPLSPDFRITEPGSATAPTIGSMDSEEGRRFKQALRNGAELDVLERAIAIPKRSPVNLQALATATAAGIHPERTIPSWISLHVAIPSRIRNQLVESFSEVMTYPEIDIPMYEPLKKISAELFLPNIQLIEQNSITLLETNQKFIEAYMVGINHEFASELLWREYPTDQRGSYFRQFWDVSSFLADPDIDREALREKLRDIPEIHTWPPDSELDAHDHREAPGDKEEEVVLVIRGELLKKYPNAVIYAHRAAWQRKQSDNTIDKAKPRILQDLTPAEQSKPPRDIIKTPLYEARVDPDITFFGFDLTAEAAKGGFIPPNGAEEDPGWFFVIKERPGEPRFGLDLPQGTPQATLHTWNELAWTDVMTTYTEGALLKVGERAVTLTDPGTSTDASKQAIKEQHDEDRRFRWRADTHASELAYILYQVPVLMGVHAAEMLPKDK
ncbi:MAG TPA: hypothetical protein VF658_19310 [Pyrinomonadaceae bacterium]|jgi:hypothetical protein